MKKFEASIIIGFILALILTSFTAFARDTEIIEERVLRLHILANSDSVEDQALKILVRDTVLAEYSELFSEAESLVAAEELAAQETENIENTALQVINENGFDYDVSVIITDVVFDTRLYEDVALPAGDYRAVEILIGAGQGKNWWCVMFPPLCVAPAMDSEDFDEYLETDSQVTDGSPEYDYRFACVDIVTSVWDFFTGSD